MNALRFFTMCFCAAPLFAACAASASAPPAPAQGAPSAPGDDAFAAGKHHRACTEIGCTDGFRVQLEPGEGWRHGSYRFRLEVDGKKTTCQGSLPLKRCEDGMTLRCSGDVGDVTESGCAIEPKLHGFSEVVFRGMPKTARIVVERDGTVVADRSFSPTYRRSHPNGPGCEPVCHNASDTMRVNAR